MPSPSTAHQSLVTWAIRKMQADGYTPFAYDGGLPQFDCLRRLLNSQSLSGLRPDALGYSYSGNTFALAEAKTAADLLSTHTNIQFRHYRALLAVATGAHLYLAIPRSAAMTLDRVLRDAGLHMTSSVMRLHIPDCFVSAEEVLYV